MTAEELLRYSNGPYHHELVEGILHEMEPPGAEHGVVGTRFGRVLDRHVEAHDLGVAFTSEVGFKIASDPDTVLGPDVSFVARERVEATGIPKAYWLGPPDLAVEVSSPNDRPGQIAGKTRVWMAGGCPALVGLDPPTRRATVHRPDGDVRVHEVGDVIDLDDVVPGFAPPVSDLFA